MPRIDECIYRALCLDPTYPCRKCKLVADPMSCTNKNCVAWRKWMMCDWITMQFNAGIFDETEFKKRMARINAT